MGVVGNSTEAADGWILFLMRLAKDGPEVRGSRGTAGEGTRDCLKKEIEGWSTGAAPTGATFKEDGSGSARPLAATSALNFKTRLKYKGPFNLPNASTQVSRSTLLKSVNVGHAIPHEFWR